METTGKITILLGPSGAGKLELLLSLAGLKPVSTHSLPFVESGASVSLCTRQQLLPDHLTLSETLSLGASVYGLQDRAQVERLLDLARLAESASRQRLYDASRYDARMLGLLWALLPNPDVLLIDDLADGLSSAAKKRLWGFIRAEQQRRPRTILYATRDLEVACRLGDEVWWLEKGYITRRWRANELPAWFRSMADYAFEFKTPVAGCRFYQKLNAMGFVLTSCFHEPRSVEALVEDKKHIVELARLAGPSMLGVSSLPVLADYIPEEKLALSPTWDPPQLSYIVAPPGAGRLGVERALPARVGKAIVGLAVSQWRRHFRSFLRWLNPWFTGLYQLVAMLIVSVQIESMSDFLRLSPLALLVSSTLILGLSMEAINLPAATGEAATLFEAAQPKSEGRPLSMLALYDMAPVGRRMLLCGLALGEYLVLLVHSWPLLVFALSLGLFSGGTLFLLLSSLLFWVLSSLSALALAVIAGLLLNRPGQGLWLGWMSWPVVALGSYYLLPTGWPVSWLWPFTGYVAAFERLFDPIQSLAPFGLAVLGTLALWGVAAIVFQSRSSLWEGKQNR